MKILKKILLAGAIFSTCLPIMAGSTITVDAKSVDLGKYPMACSAYEVDLVTDNGNFSKQGCYNDFSSAVNKMKTLGDDAVVRHGNSFSQTNIVAMNNGLAFTYPFRGKGILVNLSGKPDLSGNWGSTYTVQHVQMRYLDTYAYNGDGTGSVHVNLNGFEGYMELEEVDLVPIKFITAGLPILLGGNETYYASKGQASEQPFWITPLINRYDVRMNGNYKDMLFYSYYGYPRNGQAIPNDNGTALPAADWMEVGRTYYCYDGHTFYYDANCKNFAGDYYNYYEYLPLRSKTNITADVFNKFLSDKGYGSASSFWNQGQTFIDAQNTYGINAALAFSMGCLESSYATYAMAVRNNNFFGWGAVDTAPSSEAKYDSVKRGIIQQMSDNLVQFIDMEDYRFYGSHLGNKGSGCNVKYASAAYWGRDIASIAYALDKCSHNYDGNLTDKDTYQLGVLAFKAKASYTPDGKNAYDLMSAGGTYQEQVTVIVLAEAGNSYKTQCTNSIENGKIYSSATNIHPYYWDASVGYFKKSDVTLVNKLGTNAQPVKEEVVTVDSVEDSHLLRSVDSVKYDDATSTITLEGMAFFSHLPANDSDSVKHELVLVNAATSEQTVYPAETNNYNNLFASQGQVKIGYKTSLNLREIPSGNYYLRIRVTNNNTVSERKLLCTQKNIDVSISRDDETIQFFANTLAKYRLDISVERQSLDLFADNKPTRRNAFFGYRTNKLEQGIWYLDGYGVINQASITQADNPQFTIYLEDDNGEVYEYAMTPKASILNYADLIGSKNPATFADFSGEMDVNSLEPGTYRVYLGITTNNCNELLELYSSGDEADRVWESEGKKITLKKSSVRGRYILTVE